MRTPEEAQEALAELAQYLSASDLSHDAAMSLEMVHEILTDLNEKVERLGKIVLRMHGLGETPK